MMSHRFISFLLLATYGLPAGLGPFWHSHNHANGGCCSDHGEVTHCVVPDTVATEGTHACSDAHHHGASASEVGESSDASSLGVRQDVRSTDVCLICSFYSQAVLPPVLEESQVFQGFSHAVALAYLSYSPMPHSAFQARGPPLGL
ncbi:hypothetical protein FF011L_52990 [Roseimaritima multifibrata]|uniref:Uncharacterized protein n=1 Tax=Roseimaritima multifibrata TaxID=1930274 RepID=A0A517MNM3_9BACT|nr:hypothetical protein FF011L_52990 [Roseimaritima multifibrata]